VDFEGVTSLGPPVDDPVTFDRLPADLQRFLGQANGLVAYHGGIHIRGDQSLLRGNEVVRLLAETGELQPAHASFDGFLAAVEHAPATHSGSTR
jgi:hypothetical protein